MRGLSSLVRSRRVGAAVVAAQVAVLVAGLVTVPLSAPAGATPGTTLYAFSSGFDRTGSSLCLPTSDYCTLQGALDAAGALASGPVTVYLESSGPDAAFQGESNALYHLVDPGLDVTIEPDPSLGAGAVTFFDARFVPGSSLLTLSGSGSVSLSDVEMIHGDATSSGGAIRISSDLTVDVSDSTFDDNATIGNSNGGAIGVDNGVGAQLTVSNCSFVDNWAIGVGGAIGGYQSSGTTTVVDSSFVDNHGDYGGAIGEGAAGSGTLSVSGSTFEGNSAYWGGAIDNGDIAGDSTGVVQDSTFVDNVATSTGGAIANGINSGTGTLYVLRSTIDDGAASTPAVAGGGGATVFAGSVVSGSDLTLCAGTISDAGYNLEADAAASCGFVLASDVPAGSAVGLGDLSDNGGTTLSEELAATSPAADAIPSSPATVVTLDATPYLLCADPDTDQTGTATATPLGCTLGALDATHQVAAPVPVVVAPTSVLAASASVELSATGAAPGAVDAFSTSTPGCSLTGATLRFTGTTLPTTCEVQVSTPATGPYLASATSPTQGFTFVAGVQAALTLTSTSGRFGSALTLTSTGGSGGGALSYVVRDGSAKGCTLTGVAAVTLTTKSAGTCVLQATKAASGDYLAASSPLTSVDVVAHAPAAPTVRLVAKHGWYAIVAVSDSQLGGDPETAIQYRINTGRWKTAIRRGHGRIEVLTLPPTRDTIEVRVYTAAGRSPASAPLRFLAD